ncbi:MAG: TIGR00282 family metallophosphoesterase [Acutalibacteraceae bacterium]|nr:TIGR00282 family metallophosphoesterase [Acutalibacteraceae bacterium]
MNILAIGDVVGTIGCQFLRSKLPALKKSEKIDLVIANGENSADGNGITPASADFLFHSGVDVITAGNHTFRRKECYNTFDEQPFLIRPANYPDGTTPGHGSTVFDLGRQRVTVINLMGCMYMEALNDPYTVIDRILQKVDTRIIVLDFHAEATAEKLALAYYLDGKISAFFGTHTHVPTADAMILPNGTGYITDVGMTGPRVSVLGVKTELAIRKFKEKLPVRFETATGDCKMDCIKFTVDDRSGKTVALKRIEIL